MTPSPLLRDMGSNPNAAYLEYVDPTASTPPLSRGMWAAQILSMEEMENGGWRGIGEQDTQGETQVVVGGSSSMS